MTTRLVPTLGAIGVALGLASPALADHENRSKPWWDRNVSRERPDVDDAHWGHGGHRYAPRRWQGHHHGHGHQARQASYHCAPCRHRFHDYGAFQQHVHHHHHVPFWRVPFVMVEVAFGWIFYG